MEKLLKTPKKEVNIGGPEKPISIWGASFTEVLAALLKTKPMPKEKEIKNTKRQNV